MPMSKLGVFWSVMHRRPTDYDYFRRLQPSIFKILDGGVPDYQWARDNLPNSLIIARDWALSEQHSDMMSNPVGTGQRHAQEWDTHQMRLGFDKNKTLILGINEPRVWDAGVSEALRQYTIAMCDESTKLGLRVGAMQLSVGWPNNRGPDTLPDWSPWGGVEAAIRRNNGALVCHEYWADNGPVDNWGWWAGRVLRCPWNVPIVIGECGVDMYVREGSVPHSSRGWRGRMDADRYAHELREYVSRMSADARYVGCAVFASDFANHEWFSFDIEPAYSAILNASEPPSLPPIPQPSAPIEIHLPSIQAPKTPTAIVGVDAGARIRSGPGTSYSILGNVLKGTPLSILGRSFDSSWWQVESDWGKGWVSGGIVDTFNTEKTPVVTVAVPIPSPVLPLDWEYLFKSWCRVLGVDPTVARAVLAIESGGRSFENGRMIIRFENHIFQNKIKEMAPGLERRFHEHFRYGSPTYTGHQWRVGIDSVWWDCHKKGQEGEWAVFNVARSIHESAAMQSISMGSGQIMGFNYRTVGYPSVQAMFEDYSSPGTGELNQLTGFFAFIVNTPELLQAVRKKEWQVIALLYNGSGNTERYSELLREKYEELSE